MRRSPLVTAHPTLDKLGVVRIFDEASLAPDFYERGDLFVYSTGEVFVHNGSTFVHPALRIENFDDRDIDEILSFVDPKVTRRLRELPGMPGL